MKSDLISGPNCNEITICPHLIAGSLATISRQTLHSAAADQKGSKQAARSPITGCGGASSPLGKSPNPDQAGATSSSTLGRLLVTRDPDAGPGRVGHRAEQPATAANGTSASGQHGNRKVKMEFCRTPACFCFPMLSNNYVQGAPSARGLWSG